MKVSRVAISASLLAFALSACGQGTPNAANSVPAAANQPAVAAVAVVKPTALPKVSPAWNNTARFLAGLAVEDGQPLAALADRKSVVTHTKELGDAYAAFNERRLKRMQRFAGKELNDLAPATGPVYYPFSGPDALHALSLFGNVNEFVFTGLEPAGQIPDLATLDPKILHDGLYMLRQSLGSALQASFFKTHEMKVHLVKNPLEGVTPILLLFLARHDQQIIAVEPFVLNAKGELRVVEGDPHDKLAAVDLAGVRVKFMRVGDPRERMITYLSADMSDTGLAKTPQYLEFVKKSGFKMTFIKSASYLMHIDAFSRIRGFIVDGSQLVVQDDSGIPFRYFADNDWNRRFYGTYVGPIPMFANRMQKDMRQAFVSEGAQPIDFIFGYNYRDRGNTLMRFSRKLTVADNK